MKLSLILYCDSSAAREKVISNTIKQLVTSPKTGSVTRKFYSINKDEFRQTVELLSKLKTHLNRSLACLTQSKIDASHINLKSLNKSILECEKRLIAIDSKIQSSSVKTKEDVSHNQTISSRPILVEPSVIQIVPPKSE